MTDSLNEIRRRKRDMRRDMQNRRDALRSQYPDAVFGLRDQFLKNMSLPPGVIVSAYMAFGSEIDPAPLVDALLKQGCKVALPVVPGKGVPLIFRLYKAGDTLAIAGAMNVLEPSVDAQMVEPDIVLVPLLAFDRRKFRLGYGGGYYDRTLVMLRPRKHITAIGIGYAGQEVAEVPVGPYDVPLDKIITENQIIS